MNCPKCSVELKPSTKFCIQCGASVSETEPNATVDPADPLIGRMLLEQFLIQKRLGEGGFGAVYLAEQPRLRRQVAIKALHPHLGRNPDIVRRFEVEGMAASQIDHPLALKMHASGETEDRYLWLAMEFLEGETLADRLKRVKSIPAREFVSLFKSACEVLEAAHEVGIKHRDLKPENLMLVQSKQGFVVKILDFGIASIVSAASKTTSEVSGSPPYMAPEQFKGLKFADQRSDIYSLGVIAYRSLTGLLPIVGDDFWSWGFKHKEEKPKDPREAAPEKNIPEAVALAILKAMEKKPDDRFQTPMAFWRDMGAAFTDTPPELSKDPPKETLTPRPPRPLKKPRSFFLSLLGAILLVSFAIQYQDHGKKPLLPQDPEVSAIKADQTQTQEPGIIPGSRFVDNQDGTVTDRKSKPPLMWSKYDNGEGTKITMEEANEKPHTLALDWNDAKSSCKNLRAGGYQDWRLPSIAEASTLYKTGNYISMKETAWTVRVTDLIVLTGCCTWTSDNNKGVQAALFTFAYGKDLWGPADGLNGTTRALCVRSLQ